MMYRLLSRQEHEAFTLWASEHFGRLSIDGSPISIMHPAIKQELARCLSAAAQFELNQNMEQPEKTTA